LELEIRRPIQILFVFSPLFSGLNENKGQRILLRLRTDDLQGWRKILSIRKVLYHEMAHNVHSDHDDQFHILMRTIEREVNAFNQSGRVIGGSTYIQAASTSCGPAAFAGGVGRLGGASADLTQMLPARVMAGHAALKRLSEEEKEIEEACASGRHAAPTLPALPTPSQEVDNDSSCYSSSNYMVESGEEEGRRYPPSPLSHHHHPELQVVEPPMPQATEEELRGLEKSSSVAIAPSTAPASPTAQAPPTLLSAIPWAETTPPPSVQNGKEITAAFSRQPPSSTSRPEEAVASISASVEKADLFPLAPPPDEITTSSIVAPPTADAAIHDATEQLLGLGFAEIEVRRALQESGGDVMQAADYLLMSAEAEKDRGGGGEEGRGEGMDSEEGAAAAAAVGDSALSHPFNSRQARVMDAVQRLAQQTRGDREVAALAFTTLHSMLQSLLDHPQEPKYKRVRLTNVKFQRALGRLMPAMDLLRAVGFEERDGGAVLEYTRNDPGLLWWGKSAMEGVQDQASKFL